MIELRHVTAGYGGRTVLIDVSVDFEKGKLTSVIGVNGCGKSTLLKAILGVLPARNGEISIDRQTLENISRNGIARKIAYLPQGKSTPDMTVEQMVLHGRFPHLDYPRRYTKQDREIALSAMKQVGIDGYADKPLYALSGGMRQNAYIAMAIAQNTDYILLDEPTTYLDIAHQMELMKTLCELADKGKGIVAVMHDLPMAFTYSDRIVLLHEGNVVSNDSPEWVCEQNAIRKIFGIDIQQSINGYSYHYVFPHTNKRIFSE